MSGAAPGLPSPLSLPQRLRRLRARLEELELWLDRAWRDLEGWRFGGQPIALGERWPDTAGVLRLELASARVPEAWPLEETRLEIRPGGEGLLRVAYEDGRREAFGLDPWHHRFPLRAAGFSLSAEVVARRPFGRPSREPRLEAARLVWTDPPARALHRRLRLVADTAAALADGDVASLLLAAAERALACVRLPGGSAEYVARGALGPQLQSIWSPPAAGNPPPLPEAARESLRGAEEALAAELAAIAERHPPRGRLALEGHAHIDLAWLWPLEETARKGQRTFHTAAGLLDRFPELTFTQSSAELYQLVRELEPELFSRVAELVAGGRWDPAGGMWVEPDLNMTSGESLARQLLHGQRWFERAFGTRHRVAWLPDCFGFTPGLPQLLRQAGIEAMFTTKLTWSETDRFPYDLFWWEGLDGSRVLVHSFDNSGPQPEGLGMYNGGPDPATLAGVWDRFRGRLIHDESLFTIGYGDGGGGPTAEMVEDVRALDGFPTLPRLAFTRVAEVFDRLRASASAAETPTWSGELYLELHRGTLTTQGRTKWRHRRAERDLVAAEVAWSLTRLLGLAGEPPDLAGAWRLLLRNQFHDILPGSGIAEVYRRAEAELADVAGQAGGALAAALERLAGEVAPAGSRPAALLLNPDLSERPLRAVLGGSLPGAQPVEEGWAVTGAEGVRGLEAAVIVEAPPPAEAARAQGRMLENGLLRVELAEDGTIASIHDRRAGREVLEGPGNQLWAYSDRPRDWDAWEVDADHAREGRQLELAEPPEVVEPGPHRAALRLRWRFEHSSVTQTVRLWAGSPRLEFHTRLDWHDRRVLLKARFPLAVRSTRAAFETAFGVVERPAHRNTGWDAARFEVAGHRFADLSEPGYGVALLNDGRYGHHVLGNELGLSLLRSPVYPDPLADEGDHELTYALVPHTGGWLEGGVLAEAEDLNRPLAALSCRADAPARRRPLVVSGGVALALGTLKAAEEGQGLVLRLYEPQGARGRAEIALPPGWRVAAGLNLLEDSLGEPELDFKPFQVRTYRLEGDGR